MIKRILKNLLKSTNETAVIPEPIIEQEIKLQQVFITDNGINNIVQVAENITPTGQVKIEIKGNNNRIIIRDLSKMCGQFNISLNGNNCVFESGNDLYIASSLVIVLGQDHQNFGLIDNTKCTLGNNICIEGMSIVTFHSNAYIELGNNLMVSDNVVLYHTDGHPIYDNITGKIINPVHRMVVGDDCWLGAKCTILKNVILPPGTIVGYNAVVSKSFTDPNGKTFVLAGNPAKIVRRDVFYKQSDIEYIKNQIFNKLN